MWGVGVKKRFEDAADDIGKTVLKLISHRTHGTPARTDGTPVSVEEEAEFNENNMLSTFFLIKGAEVARFVGKLKLTGTQGTGFMVSKRLLMTNWHVFHPVMKNNGNKRVTSSLAYFDATVTFGDVEVFRFCIKPENLKTAEFALQPDVFYYENEKLDVGVVAVAEISFDGKSKLSDYGHCQAVRSKLEHLTTGDRINIIQYPDGKRQKVVLRKNMIVHLDSEGECPRVKFFECKIVGEMSRFFDRGLPQFPSQEEACDKLDDKIYYRYKADTVHGSSGSACFDDEWRLVCMHHVALYMDVETKFETGPKWRNCLDKKKEKRAKTDREYLANEGIIIGWIRQHLEKDVFTDPKYKYDAKVLGALFEK